MAGGPHKPRDNLRMKNIERYTIIYNLFFYIFNIHMRNIEKGIDKLKIICYYQYRC